MIDEKFKALSQLVRVRTAVMLIDRELCVCDLMEVLSLPQSTVSRHMSRLKAAGLVSDRRDGKWVYYRLAELSDECQKGLIGFLRCLREQEPFSRDLGRLSEYLKQKETSRCER